PGNDGISFTIVKRAYTVAPELFKRIYSILFEVGYHPKAWREAVGVVLPKPNKPDYSFPKSYSISSLLNCLGKTLEKIMATRL
ncbi:hypothetical protein M501DRAFT_906790, partial [Patellaria atrata CBS 101060]